MEIILINEELFKDNGPIKEDTIITKFVPYINIAQKMYIERILGTPLTNELKNQIKEASKEGARGEEITPKNQALILKLAPVLSFYAVYQGLPFHWASIVNKGITLRNSENSDAVSVNDIAQLRRWIKDDAEELGRDLIEYLCGCKNNYSLTLESWSVGAVVVVVGAVVVAVGAVVVIAAIFAALITALWFPFLVNFVLSVSV